MGVSSGVTALSSAAAGVSSSGSTLTVKVFGVASKPPSLSCTEKVKLAYGVPFSLASGTNCSLPAAMSATLMTWPAFTATPPSSRLPWAGRVSMRTAARVSPVSTSVKPKSSGWVT